MKQVSTDPEKLYEDWLAKKRESKKKKIDKNLNEGVKDVGNPVKDDFNVKITRFFLDNKLATFLALLSVLGLGILSFFNLKATGFPSPSVNVVSINTVYPLASSGIVEEQVTKPIEQNLKELEEIENINAVSTNSFSNIVVYIKNGQNVDSAISKITSEVSGVKLPDDAKKPVINKLNIGSADYILNIFGTSPESSYDQTQKLKLKIEELEGTKNVSINNEVERKVSVSVNPSDILAKGFSVEKIATSIKSYGQTLPVSNEAVLGSSVFSIATKTPDLTLENLKNIQLTNAFGQTEKLENLAKIEITNEYVTSFTNSIKNGDNIIIASPVSLTINTLDDVDQGEYLEGLEKILSSQENLIYKKHGKKVDETKDFVTLEYSIDESNKEQVSEIVKGLIGGRFNSDNWFIKNIGWIFGALQLVFLSMMFLVSPRAAVIAAFSIPLSITFTLIYLYLTGGSLNTLVLFSLVLVIGLVVDPALVVLEAIQRKIDAGLKGKMAALAAVKDVGPSLFLAVLSNIVVFLPLALVSGFIGEIFSYIPKTIVPALVGSYFVPMVFLAVVGAKFLNRKKGAVEDEAKNMWAFAKWLVQFNSSILKSSFFVKLLVILTLMGLSFGVTGYLFKEGMIKPVQFSSAKDAKNLIVNVDYSNISTESKKDELNKELIKTISQNKNVQSVFFFDKDAKTYYVNLKSKSEGRLDNAVDISKKIQEEVKKISGIEATVSPAQVSGPKDKYPISLAVFSSNTDSLTKSSQKIKSIADKVCVNGKNIELIDNCKDDNRLITKVDASYLKTNNEKIFVFDVEKLKANNLVIDNLPILAIVNQQFRDKIDAKQEEKVNNLNHNGEVLNVVIDKQSNPVKTEAELESLVLVNTKGEPVPLTNIGYFINSNSQPLITSQNGKVFAEIKMSVKDDYSDQANVGKIQNLILEEVKKESTFFNNLGVDTNQIEPYSQGPSAEFAKSFKELLTALVVAIFIIYILLVIALRSILLPFVVLFTIPLTFIGIFPALSYFIGGQFGFLEIIGIIILVGLVINSAIFLIDAARQKEAEGMSKKEAIALASGLRLRPVILTKVTAIASLLPLAIESEFYRPIALVIMFGILTSGFLSLISTPILYIFFSWIEGLFKKKA